jgi:hypothetical protein
VAFPKKQPEKSDAPTPASDHPTPPKGDSPKPPKLPAKPSSQPPRTVIEPLEDRQHL